MRGSEWRKWDFHVHTKGTNKNDLFTSDTMDSFFEVFFKKAYEKNICGIGITDYFTIDNYLLAKKYVNDIENKVDAQDSKIFSDDQIKFIKNIFLFPNVELRMLPTTGVEKLVNIHCIFNPAYIYHLANDFFSSIENQEGIKMNKDGFINYGRKLKPNISDEKQLFNEGLNHYVISPESLKKLIDKNSTLRENTILVVSNSNKDGNSGYQKHYDFFENEKGSLDGVRKTIYHISNCIFSTNVKDINYFLGKRLDQVDGATAEQKLEERKTVLLERGSFKACLVGSDAHQESDLFSRFTWVKADLNFEGLKQIIYEPEERVRIQVEEPDYKDDRLVIDEISYVLSEGDNLFTPHPIKLNKNLNVIIGGKSSGKSILLYNIAKTLLSDRRILKKEHSSNEYKYNFNNFDFRVKMKSGIEQSVNRGDNEPSILSEIKYIPQNYLSKLADPENKKGNELRKLVRELLLEENIYRLKYQDFISKVISNDGIRELLINDYFVIKDRMSFLNGELLSKGREDVLVTNIKANTEKIEKLQQSINLSDEQTKQYNSYNDELEKINIEVGEIMSDYTKAFQFNSHILSVMSELIQRKNLMLSSISNDNIKSYLQNEYVGIDNLFNVVSELSKILILDTDRQFLNQGIFKEEVEHRLRKKKELEGLLELYKLGAVKVQIEQIEKTIVEDKQKLSSIQQINKDIKANELALLEQEQKIFNLYEENYLEYEKIVSELTPRTSILQESRLEIKGYTKFNFPKLRKKVLEISNGRAKSYDQYDIFNDNKTGVSEFNIKELVVELKSIFNAILNETYKIKSVDTKAALKMVLDDYFFDYWEAIYDEDTLDEMSTGKASFVILMLIVGLSISEAPILIDQPEDNLDNRSITKDLVTYLREKKRKRQIILVTHNPNVVVNADAENIIVANQKNQTKNRSESEYHFDYVNGAIEFTKPYNKDEKDVLKSMGIREHIADVVEGGKDAFKKREKKYSFS